MSDNTTSYNATAFNSVALNHTTLAKEIAGVNSTGVLTIANTLSITNFAPSPDAAVSANTTNCKLTIHDSGLMEFNDAEGNIVLSRQKTLRKFVEKLISCGIAS
jgi:hypothetical protein